MPRRLSALFDTPSLPLVPPPSPNGTGTSPTRSPGFRPLSSDPVTPTNRQRNDSSSPYASAHSQRRNGGASCRTEDFTQFGVVNAKKLKLKQESVMRLEDFSKMASSASKVSIFAQLLKITEMQALVSPAAAAFTMPKKLDHKIDIHSIRTMMSPSLAFYVKKAGGDTPSSIMKALVQEHASPWGLTAEVLDDKTQWGVVTTRIRIRLTDCRYEIKKVISDSIWVSIKSEEGDLVVTDCEEPLTIIQLCEALVDIVPDAGLKVTLPMLGRVALLRHVLIEYDNEEVRISKAIAKVLKNDCCTYGDPDLSIFT
ncbi:hypothetical protein DFH09DRAFT_1301613 [Mycena vulgaris]|nr:hypothetical protein DFH09DRAFT_1301613 [Mycena vulgaris]